MPEYVYVNASVCDTRRLYVFSPRLNHLNSFLPAAVYAKYCCFAVAVAELRKMRVPHSSIFKQVIKYVSHRIRHYIIWFIGRSATVRDAIRRGH